MVSDGGCDFNALVLSLLKETSKADKGKFVYNDEEKREKYTLGKGCVEYMIKVDMVTPPGYAGGEIKLGKFKKSYRKFAKELTPENAEKVSDTLKTIILENKAKLFSKK